MIKTKGMPLRESSDLRVRLSLMLGVSVLSFTLRYELSLLILFLSLCFWLYLFGLKKEMLGFLFWYAFLWIGLSLIRDIPLVKKTALAFVGVYARRLMLPIMCARTVMQDSHGKFMATLSKMKLPRTLVLSLSILLRFMPTLREEFRHIKNARKSRGIASSVVQTLAHPLLSLECTLIPLLIRTCKIADELAASASVRGAKIEGERSSWYEVSMRTKDWILLLGCMMFLIMLYFFDPYLGRLSLWLN